MIEKTDSIISMLKNVIEQSTVILNDFERNEETHYAYVLEKLRRAKGDLDILIEIAEAKRDES